MASLFFDSWLRRKPLMLDRVLPEADKVVPLVAQAGARGMSRIELGKLIDLEPNILDQLIAGLVGAGQLTAGAENGLWVYRAGRY